MVLISRRVVVRVLRNPQRPGVVARDALADIRPRGLARTVFHLRAPPVRPPCAVFGIRAVLLALPVDDEHRAPDIVADLVHKEICLVFGVAARRVVVQPELLARIQRCLGPLAPIGVDVARALRDLHDDEVRVHRPYVDAGFPRGDVDAAQTLVRVVARRVEAPALRERAVAGVDLNVRLVCRARARHVEAQRGLQLGRDGEVPRRRPVDVPLLCLRRVARPQLHVCAACRRAVCHVKRQTRPRVHDGVARLVGVQDEEPFLRVVGGFRRQRHVRAARGARVGGADDHLAAECRDDGEVLVRLDGVGLCELPALRLGVVPLPGLHGGAICRARVRHVEPFAREQVLQLVVAVHPVDEPLLLRAARLCVLVERAVRFGRQVLAGRRALQRVGVGGDPRQVPFLRVGLVGAPNLNLCVVGRARVREVEHLRRVEHGGGGVEPVCDNRRDLRELPALRGCGVRLEDVDVGAFCPVAVADVEDDAGKERGDELVGSVAIGHGHPFLGEAVVGCVLPHVGAVGLRATCHVEHLARLHVLQLHVARRVVGDVPHLRLRRIRVPQLHVAAVCRRAVINVEHARARQRGGDGVDACRDGVFVSGHLLGKRRLCRRHIVEPPALRGGAVCLVQPQLRVVCLRGVVEVQREARVERRDDAVAAAGQLGDNPLLGQSAVGCVLPHGRALEGLAV